LRAFLLCLAVGSKDIMAKIILVTGGARSGKSRFAEEQTLKLASNAIYIATAQAFDAEMSVRIAEHRARRGAEWTTRDAPLALSAALDASDGATPRLVDCLTLWLSNLLLAEQDWQAAVQDVTQTLARQKAPVVLVTNEVGAGIVPDNALARVFRDAAGIVNQRVAGVADEVFLLACGLPLRLK
jgi:adenosylcobinamide kinase / adenosylcobinamide-phosphate guanylyltransferase